MDYGRILKRAVEITWRHKALWVFGFVLALFGGGWGSGQGVQYRLGPSDLARPEWALGLVLFVTVVVIALVVVGIVLSNLSRGALIGMVHEVEETGSTSVHSGWHAGRSRLVGLIGVDVITVIPAVIVAMTLIALALTPLLLLIPERAGIAQRELLTALGIVLAVVLSLAVLVVILIGGAVLGIIRELAYRRCVFEGTGVWRSIREGSQMARANLRQVGMMWILLFGIDLAADVVVLPLAVAGFGLAAGIGVSVYAATRSVVSAVVVGMILGVPVLLVMSFVRGVYLAFRSTAWTLLYRELPTSWAQQ